MREVLTSRNHRNHLVVTFALLMTLLFTACQKENVEELSSLQETPKQEITTEITPTEAPNNPIEFEKPTAERANARSATYLIHQGTYTVARGNWKSHFIHRSNLPDPAVWRVEAIVRPVYGNPDMYIYGYDGAAASPWRRIRSSANPGAAQEQESYRLSGLKEVEEYSCFSIYARSNMRYEITIYAITVDCQEYAPENQQITLEYRPVCGCDGNEYGNPSSAWVAGITSWTFGGCATNITGTWRNIDAHTDGITRMIISNDLSTMHLFGACHPTDCDWGLAALSYDGTWYRATYDHGFATRHVKIKKRADGKIRMELYTDYHDSRIDKTNVYIFR